MLDEISEAVLAREELLKYPREQVNAYLDELRTTQRHKFYRALQHPLYPILRKIERKHENLHYVIGAVRAHRIVYASNHKSHTDYLVEPLVLDDNGIRPPLIAAGINLFGGPLGLIHKHVTGAIPIRRNTKDPAYLITLKAYVAEILKKHDLFFYPGGRAQLQRRAEGGEDRAVQRRAERRPARSGDHSGRRSPTTSCSRITSSRGSASRSGSGRSAASSPRWCATPSATARARSSPSARRSRSASVDVALAQRRARAGAAGPRAHRRALQGAADGGVRRGDAAVDHAARSRDRASIG